MGLLLVVLVFVFPLAFPVVTLATLLSVALAAERWMHVAVVHTGVRYHVFQYAGFCVVLLLALLVAVAIWRGSPPQTSLKGHAPFIRRRPPPR